MWSRAPRWPGLILTALLVLGGAASAVGAVPAPQEGTGGASLPTGGPPALHEAEPVLPGPEGWAFGEGFPRTSGFGRLLGGALFWSDFLHDDRGARGVPVNSEVFSSSAPDGTYVYPAGAAAENGADVFRTAVALDREASYWRVDWQTLIDPRLPMALWAFDTDSNAATGASTWPASAGVRSPGVERWLLMSGSGAWVIDQSGNRTNVVSTVDRRSRSFVATVPKTLLAPSGRWRVRLGAGLSGASGTAFAPVPLERGARVGQPAVFNVGFRSDSQEPVRPTNWWREDAQAAALASGDVSTFSISVDWRALATKRTTPEPRLFGFSNRWYVSSIEPGQGIVRNPPQLSSDMAPNFLNRVQPYGIYVPREAGSRPAPLTLLLHSLFINHNQYAVYNPDFLAAACEKRASICITPMGRGPDSWYFDEGELDVWEVWNRVAANYLLDPSRTVVGGYSMGGIGTYRFGYEHPDLFAQAFVLAGVPNCSLRIVAGAEIPAVPGLRKCESEADFSSLVSNARELPFYIGAGALDELAYPSAAVEHAQRYDDRGQRYRFELYANQDHVGWYQNGVFEGVTGWLSQATRAATPARIDYRFHASHVRPDLGAGPTSAWWLSGLRARGGAPGLIAHVRARSGALPDRSAQPSRVPGEPVSNRDGAAVARQLSWPTETTNAGTGSEIALSLADVSSVVVDLPKAGIAEGRAASVRVESDGDVQVTLTGLRTGSKVGSALAGPAGRVVVQVPAGATVIEVRPAGTGSPGRVQLPDSPSGALAATGGPSPTLSAAGTALLVVVLLLLRRRSVGAGSPRHH